LQTLQSKLNSEKDLEISNLIHELEGKNHENESCQFEQFEKQKQAEIQRIRTEVET
jgi:hypothetical protein